LVELIFTSRGSICAIKAPSTRANFDRIRIILRLDLMSTGLIGSTLPVACTRTAMSSRVCRSRGAGPVVLALHARRRGFAKDATRNE
jgi:hypothetical protein